MSVVFLHSYWSLLFAVLFGHWWVHFRHERCGCRCCSVVTPLRKATQLCSLFQQIWSARFDECLLVSSKFRTSNTPKLQSPWLILKGSWFSKIQGNEWCLVPCPGVHQQFLADQWSVQTIARWKGMENLNRGTNLLEESSTLAKGIYRSDMISIMYPSSPWRGETAASRDGNFRRVPCIIQSSNEQHSPKREKCDFEHSILFIW